MLLSLLLTESSSALLDIPSAAGLQKGRIVILSSTTKTEALLKRPHRHKELLEEYDVLW